MINEEDHIRIQAMKAGLDLENAFAAAVDAVGCSNRGLILPTATCMAF
jgi:hypothetical protein